MLKWVLQFLFYLSLAGASVRAADVITLTLPASIAESSSAQGTVTLDAAPGSALTVALASADTRLQLPTHVIVPAGQFAVNFTFHYLNDAYLDDNTLATVSATASGWTAGAAQVTLVDGDSHTLNIFTGPLTLTEGSTSGWGFWVYAGGLLRSDVTVTMQNGDTSEVAAPATLTLTIPAGQSQTSSTYNLNAVDDEEKDGAQVVTITASAPRLTSATMQVTVRDNDPDSISWPVIRGPVIAGTALPV